MFPGEDITDDGVEDFDDDGLGVEDSRTEITEETGVREDDLDNDVSENILVSNENQQRYNLRSRKINMTFVYRGQLKMNSIKEREHLKIEKTFTSILKFKDYKTKDNYKIDFFRLNSCAHF